jgi:hypothetical protein
MRIRVKKPFLTMFGSLAPETVLEMPDTDRVGLWMLQHPQYVERLDDEGEPVEEPQRFGADTVLLELDGNSEIVTTRGGGHDGDEARVRGDAADQAGQVASAGRRRPSGAK